MASAEKYIHLAKSLPPQLQRFLARYPPASLLPPGTDPETAQTSYQQERPKPFEWLKHPVTGKWHDPVYSLRRQAQLLKLAREHGVEELMPPSRKAPDEQLAHRVEHGLQ